MLTLTLSLWGERAKETCHTMGWDLDLCFPFLTSDRYWFSGFLQPQLLRGSVCLDYITTYRNSMNTLLITGAAKF